MKLPFIKLTFIVTSISTKEDKQMFAAYLLVNDSWPSFLTLKPVSIIEISILVVVGSCTMSLASLKLSIVPISIRVELYPWSNDLTLVIKLP